MGPRREESLAKYRRLAGRYDRVVGTGGALVGFGARRAHAVEHLDLEHGQTVLDVGCGTGLSFALLEEWIGPSGILIGIEQSAEMLAEARRLISRRGWENVTLIQSAVEDADVPALADAALFCLVHDITRSRPALENVLRHLRPGARVAAVGAKAPPRWAFPLYFAGRAMMGRYVTTFEGAERPWTLIEELVPDLNVDTAPLHLTYAAWATIGT